MDFRKEAFLEELFKNEGWYSDHPQDTGGKTILGITQKNHPNIYNVVYSLYQQGKYGEAKRVAGDFYWNTYYDRRYNYYNTSLAWKIFDLSVNMGTRRAIKLLQQALNRLGWKLTVDGILGEKTHQALTNEETDHYKVLQELVRLAWKFYRGLATFNVFGKGWKNRLLKIIVTHKLPDGQIEYRVIQDPELLKNPS